ncbi:MAG TPA: DNA repair protein RecO, partial [Kofleriaceae bacterium]|nr:DNA repair protein RecO [Kofleriaceae bacterium]
MALELEPTDAIVLRAICYREADQVLTLFTRAYGKVSALARGSRRSRKRFGGALGSFTISRVELSRGRGELLTMSSATSVRAYLELAADMASLAHASYATELVGEIAPPEQPEPDIYDLLVELYDVLSARGPSVSVLRAFELRLLDHMGLAPVLDACVACGATAPAILEAPGAILDPGRGGVTCSGCAPATRNLGVRMLSRDARAALLAARDASGLAAAHDGGVPPPAARQAREALMSIVLSQVGRPMKSLEFAAKLAGSQRGAPDDAAPESSPEPSAEPSPELPDDGRR